MNSDSLVYWYKQKKTEHWITWSDDDDGMSYADLKRLFKKLDRESTWCNYCHEVKEKSKLTTRNSKAHNSWITFNPYKKMFWIVPARIIWYIVACSIE